MNGSIYLKKSQRMEWLLAVLLHYGTWLAAATIVLGFAYASIAPHGSLRIATLGIALLILLPCLRVLLMLMVFLHARDYRFAAIAALVLLTILFGFLVGAHTRALREGFLRPTRSASKWG